MNSLIPANLAALEAAAISAATLAEKQTWKASAAHFTLAAAYLAEGQREEAAKAEALAYALAERAESLADNLAALPPIAEGRRISDALASPPR